RRERELGPRRELVAEFREGSVEGAEPLRAQPRRRGGGPGDADAQLVAASTEAPAGELLHEEGLLRELRRQPHAYVLIPVVQGSQFQAELPAVQRDLAHPEASHAPHGTFGAPAR